MIYERKARKDYQCSVCKNQIKKGEKYTYTYIKNIEGKYIKTIKHIACEIK